MRRVLIAAAALVATAGAAHAEVVDAQVSGFQVTQSIEVRAAPAKVSKALDMAKHWWDPGVASPLSLDPRLGKCTCEEADDGNGVETFSGKLDPHANAAAAATWVWKVEPSSAGTRVTWTYTVGGYAPGGLGKAAPAVDRALSAELERLRRYAETGKPE